MKTRGLAVYVPAVLLLAAFAGGTFWSIRALRQRAERRFQAAVALSNPWYYQLPASDVFHEVRADYLDASERLLRDPGRRSQIRQSRLHFFHLSLEPAALQREATSYLGEEKGFSSKDPIFSVSQILFDCWSMPAPDSVEPKRLDEFLNLRFRPLAEVEWARGALLQRYVQAKRRLHEPAKAEEELTSVLEYVPTFAQAWYVRGRARLLQGNAKGAIRDFQEAARLDPMRPEVFRWLAQAFETAGQPGSAKAEIARALTLEPGYREALEFQEGLK